MIIPQLAARQATHEGELDALLARLEARKQAWAELPLASKVALLDRVVVDTAKIAKQWADAACAAKGIPADSQLTGEEWLSGPWALMYGARAYARSLRDLAAGGHPRYKAGSVRTRPDGQVVVEVFPQTAADALLLNGVRGEVWMEPGITPANLTENMASFYKQSAPIGKIALVLGAGNIASIGPMDVLHKLYAEGQVCLLKMNPVNEYLGPFIADAFRGFVDAGYMEVAYGGVEVGEYLTSHALVQEIHITGSAATHDAIVWGRGPDVDERKRRREPKNARHITSELGNVSPVVVVPGPWTAADIRFQAEHIVTMKMHNGGFNCIAGQVLVLPEAWPHTDALVAEIDRVMRSLPNRVAYYPGAAARQAAAVNAHPDALQLDAPTAGTVPRTIVPRVDHANGTDHAFCDEAFGSVLSETRLPGATPAQFLANAVTFCNDTLWGTLGANVLVHPTTERELGSAFEDAIAKLRYGCVAINAWSGVGFLICQTSWGAYPGHTLEDIRSGIGSVHNTLLFDKPQKSVVRAPFYPSPRGLLHGSFSILPKPPWFVTNASAATTAQRIVEFEADHNPLRLAGIFASALRG